MLVNSHSIGNTQLNLNPPPLPPSNHVPSSDNSITTQPSTSQSPLQSNAPTNAPPPTNNTITVQPTTSQIQQPLPPVPISFPLFLPLNLDLNFLIHFFRQLAPLIPSHHFPCLPIRIPLNHLIHLLHPPLMILMHYSNLHYGAKVGKT